MATNPWPDHIIGLAKDILENGRNDSIDGIMADAMFELGLPLVADHFVDANHWDHKTNPAGTKVCGFCDHIIEGSKLYLFSKGQSPQREFNDYIDKVNQWQLHG